MTQPNQTLLSLAGRTEQTKAFDNPCFTESVGMAKPRKRSQQHPNQSPVRPFDADASELPGLRRLQWRLQPPYQIGGPRSIQLALKLQF